MRWRKLGHTELPIRRPAWMVSHAAVPFAEPLTNDTLRVYFSARDAHNRSHTAWAIINVREPGRVLDLSSEPVLAPGALGCFDDSGAMLSWIAGHADQRLLYYIGWNLGVTVPFRNAIGVAVSERFGPFRRLGAGPLLDRTLNEPHFLASCCVLPDNGSWLMWYVACVGWEQTAQGPRHRYHIRFAESPDGIAWQREGKVAIDFRDSSEYAISRPSVLRDVGGWKMWYSYRGDRYRIGYAESRDGRIWERRDQDASLEPSSAGWDSEMVEYPHVFDYGGRRYMLYNGSGYGTTGFGLAVLEDR